ncbi:MAG: hypothetical protein R6U20_03810, partial [Longimonas sp.]
LLWIMGINNGLRANDLVKLKVHQVKDCKPGDTVNVIESKTKKPNVLPKAQVWGWQPSMVS